MKTKKEKIIEAPDLSVIKKKHANKWVALSADYKKLLAVGKSLAEVMKKSRDKKIVVMKVLPSFGYVPTVMKK